MGIKNTYIFQDLNIRFETMKYIAENIGTLV